MPTGFLLVNVRYANGAVPVVGASVVLEKEGAEIGEFFTDGGGKTPKISLVEGEYGLSVLSRGFAAEERESVAVFGGITTLQSFCLFPAREDEL